jgi:MFS family permease
MSAGSFAGSLAAGFVSDRLGRRKALMVAAIIWNIGAILQASAVNVAHLVAGQVVGGISIGITSSQCCVYLAELAPARIRGRIVGIQQWSIEWGILIMYLISYACVRTIDGPTSFRVAWGIQMIPGTILLISLFFFPESPRWLAQHERWEESLQTLANLHAKGDINSSVVQLEFEEVREAARIAKEQEGVTYLALFGPKVIKRTICGLS